MQVVAYALARPAREVLFTVVSRDEKYRAKLVLDTAVQRFGDALAAGLFQFLQVRGGSASNASTCIKPGADLTQRPCSAVAPEQDKEPWARNSACRPESCDCQRLTSLPLVFADGLADEPTRSLLAQSYAVMGPSRVALAAIPVCAAWSVVAYSLGRKQQVLCRRTCPCAY